MENDKYISLKNNLSKIKVNRRIVYEGAMGWVPLAMDDGSSIRNLLMFNVLFPHVCLQVKSPSSLPAMPHMPKPLSFDNII